MKKYGVLVFSSLFGVLLGFFLSPHMVGRSEAQVKTGVALGGGHAGVSVETFRFRTARGNKLSVRTQRDELVVDSGYGNLIAVNTVKNRSVLWYRGADGTVRNVIIDDGLAPVSITRQP